MFKTSQKSSAYPTVNAWTIPGTAIPCPTRRTDVVKKTLDGEAILYDPINGSTFRLNQSALNVWMGCHPGRQLDDLARDVCQQYDVDESTARDDVQQMIALFANHGLLTP